MWRAGFLYLAGSLLSIHEINEMCLLCERCQGKKHKSLHRDSCSLEAI
jgi:hypothetical protein